MLDDLDLKLMKELEENGLQSQASLGQKLGASEATVRRREHRLLDHHALRLLGIPNLSVLGCGVVAVVGLNVEFAHREEILPVLAADDQIRYLASCTGRYELLAVVVSHSVGELSQFLETLTRMVGVKGIETFLNLTVFKNRPWIIEETSPCANCDLLPDSGARTDRLSGESEPTRQRVFNNREAGRTRFKGVRPK